MKGLFTAYVQKTRESARAKASAVLADLGFTADGDLWAGHVSLSDGSLLPVHVSIPASFPDVLPEVLLRSDKPDQIAHVDRSGKVCIAPGSGILIDADRPGDIVSQALSMAVEVLDKRSSSSQSREIASEFLAYWLEPRPTTLLSACLPDAATGPICIVKLGTGGSFSLVAPSCDVARDWAKAVGKPVISVDQAFFVGLHSLPPPPAFTVQLTLRGLLSLVHENAGPDSAKALSAWLKSHGIPSMVVLSAPLGETLEYVEFASEISHLSPRAITKAERGFRKGHTPNSVIVTRALTEPLVRLEVSRVDPAYVLPRGGADISLREKTVVVVGCGSVGSHVAQALALSGVGTLVLIDPENLQAANIHRHVLGASYIGEAKVAGLERALRERLPHLQVIPYQKVVEIVLDTNPDALLLADLIIFALGDETLERRFNTFLHRKVRRIHVWLEPLGIGGHVLSLDKQGAGCLACLYRRDDIQGLVNMASLVEQGQFFQRSLAGCAGTFTPFGALDAEQAALFASREAVAMLKGERATSSLLSWIASKDLFLAAGYRLSRRGKSLDVETLKREPHFARPDCPVCGEEKI